MTTAGKPRKYSSKIKSPAALKSTLSRLRKASKKKTIRVVFTNGCFDLVHKGHVSYLQSARSLGDVLVVALNSDQSVKKLGKGPDRPINTLADRLEVIAALESVDFVTWFEEDTPLAVIRVLRPDRLVKGGDWSPDKIVGADDVRSWGGKVQSIPYVPGKSTTEIIARAKSC